MNNDHFHSMEIIYVWLSVKLNIHLIEIVAWKIYFVFFIHLLALSRGHKGTSNSQDKIICIGQENF